MKKSLIAIIALVFVVSMVNASNNLNGDYSNLTQRLERVKKINRLEKQNKEYQNQLSYITKNLKDTERELKVAVQKNKTDDVNINSLQEDNATLRELKAKLEKRSLETQQKYADENNSNIIRIQKEDKEKHNELLAMHTDNKKTLESEIAELNKEVSIQNKTIRDLNSRLISRDSTVSTMKETIATLSSQKKDLEEQFSNSHKNTISNYNSEIAKMNLKTQDIIEQTQKQYTELSSENNKAKELYKEECDKILSSDKRRMKDELSLLITKINSNYNNLFEASQLLKKNTDNISTYSMELNKAYEKMGNPYPKKSFMDKMAIETGIKEADPNWQTIQEQTKEIRENLVRVDSTMENLSKSRLSAITLQKENQETSWWNRLF
ncbi:MAG TPA: hypothetical protein QF753_07140 [Victivallales bacterium]|nr:hypothetical protein [Victivallales bacterium]